MSDGNDEREDEEARKARAKRLRAEIERLKKERPQPATPRDFVEEKKRKK